MARRFIPLFFLGLALVVRVGPAFAQEDEEAKRELARQFFLQGNDAAREGRYRAAIEAYEKAVRLAPTVGTIYRNLAVVFTKVGRCDKAIPLFDRYLELAPDAPDGDAVRAERQTCADIVREDPTIGEDKEGDGTLTLTCNIDGATVTVDGVVMGATPLQPINLKAGSYNIGVSRAGYQAWQRRIPVQGGRDVVINITLVVEEEPTEPIPETAPHLALKWTTIGVGGALIATGVVLTVLAELDRAEFEDAGRVPGTGALDISMRRARDLQDGVNNKRTASFVLYGVGGAALIGGLTWLLVDKPSQPVPTEEVTPVSGAILPGGAVVTFGGTF